MNDAVVSVMTETLTKAAKALEIDPADAVFELSQSDEWWFTGRVTQNGKKAPYCEVWIPKRKNTNGPSCTRVDRKEISLTDA